MVNKSTKIIKPGEHFSQIKHTIRPLDLILFKGTELVSGAASALESMFIGNGDWTHAGLVVTTDIVPIKNGVPGKFYIWESILSGKLGDNVNNVETDRGVFGVQIRDLEKVVNENSQQLNTKIGLCRLTDNPIIKSEKESMTMYDTRIAILKSQLTTFYEEHNNKEFDYNICNLLSATSDYFPRFNSEKRFFCSELVVAIYQHLGLIPLSIEPESIAPAEFVTGNLSLFILPVILIIGD